jgi:hypothetical protein
MPPYNAPSWKHLISAITTDAEFNSPVSATDFAAVEQQLKLSLPAELRELMLESNGITADYNVVWSIGDIQRRNLEFRALKGFRELYMPFDHLLFFGDDGGGDQFAFAVQADGIIHNPDIYRWEHETDARSWFAGRLEQFFARILNRKR